VGALQYHFLTQRTENGVVILTFTESLLNADAMNEAVAVINVCENRNVILDCHSVRSLVGDSLFNLLKLKKKLTEEAGRLVLCNVAPDVAEVLCVTRFDRIVKIRPNVESAVAWMNEPAETKTYAHTQNAPLCLILYGTALACFALAWITRDSPGIYIAGSVGLLIALLGPCFHHLSVEDKGDILAIRFGPVTLFGRTLRYADIERVEVGRTLILDGWGIHMSIRGGLVWNLWGRDCVVVHLKKGTLRIGTDDAENLARFLEGKISE
jgi:anti-anti-sigma factor